MNIRSLALVLVAPALAGCNMQTFQSSVAGSCGVFERPPYAVVGKTDYDQRVADGFVESGVAGCNWKRPAPRPPALDARPAARPAAKPPAKKPRLVDRLRGTVWPKPRPQQPAAPPASPPSTFEERFPAAVPAPAPPPEPTQLERLLRGGR